jgi:hypothetical protein
MGYRNIVGAERKGNSLDAITKTTGGVMNPDYKEQPRNFRKCEECGKMHDCIIEDMRTGERLEELSKCKNCLFKPILARMRLAYDSPQQAELYEKGDKLDKMFVEMQDRLKNNYERL